jgi:predicted amidohydrolase
MNIKVTVCEMHNEPEAFEQDWRGLVAHVREAGCELVLLPELPFYPWFGTTNQFDAHVWQAAVEAHNAWIRRLPELGQAWVVSTCPVNQGTLRHNEGFVWQADTGYRAVHRKYYLPDEEGVWEASWYHPDASGFTPVTCGNARLGMLVCTEVWAMEQARVYGKAGVQIIATPRLTQGATVEKWLAVGRTAAVLAGAFGLSSNWVSGDGKSANYGGRGWIVSPDGEVLGLTSQQEPFVTVEIDLDEVEQAKKTYPRYIFADR